MKKISNIVFTKNRPLQLHGYLESLYKFFPQGLIQTYILYKPELFEEQYDQLFNTFSDCKVIRENDFHTDLLDILDDVKTEYILFGIDDVVYFDSVDLDLVQQTFKSYSDDIFGFSLRHSLQNAKSCESVKKTFADSPKVFKMHWQTIKEYPFELCATVYKTNLIKKIIYNAKNNNPIINKLFSPSSWLIKLLGRSKLRRKILKHFGFFYAPNPLESWNCRWCQNNTSDLPAYLYYQKICASAMQINMVNTATVNQSDNPAELTVEKLAEKYKQGYRVDIDSITANDVNKAHCHKVKYKLLKKQL